MISIDDVTESKFIKTTRLAEKMGDSCVLQLEPMIRTAQAVSFFIKKAKDLGADKIYVFATAAVRQAINKKEFLDLVKDLCSIEVDVISGEIEANLGALGAVQNNGGIIDVGGASSEVLVINDGKTVFSKSLDVGAVKLTDKFGDNKESVISFIEKKVEEYGEIPKTVFFGIGGTATTLASIDQKMKVYDPKKVHGYSISTERIKEIREAINIPLVLHGGTGIPDEDIQKCIECGITKIKCREGTEKSVLLSFFFAFFFFLLFFFFVFSLSGLKKV
jgi:exopolyphosphatase/guanosine-5'-triphosphate,3'-diphosphate pyrophosphatase